MPAFTCTITDKTAGPFSLYKVLNGTAQTGLTVGGTFPPVGANLGTGRIVAYVSIQNDPANGVGALIFIGDSQLLITGANQGGKLTVGAFKEIAPSRGGNAWANLIYFNTDTDTSKVNFFVFYG